ncbi:alpha/beta fold hydrolase [Sphingomonas spermidinifaciens]|uniref:alpha/beta fold hydrolase n=1 Tax=Sphingomonas spermidinifaciens TaxID=1141889 RepID=UPI001FE63F8A|nr:alpha/beta hydrolase [Sphingomonas spermidinifaciens]
MSLIAALALLQAGAAAPAALPELGVNLERFDYPFTVERLRAPVGTEVAQMAFMDVRPAKPNGRVAVLLHGKNFCGAAWEASARMLVARGWRVLVPDQIGFCKSDKPAGTQYTLAGLAANTARLMKARGIDRAVIVGHSMGGMLAARFAIDHPALTERLVMVNPLGLTDRAAEGVPYRPLADLIADERKTDAASIKAYQLANYYHGEWRPAYDRWVRMLAGQFAGAGREAMATAQGKTSEMIFTQPVLYQFGRIKAPTTVIVGTRDTTVFAKRQAPPTLQQFLKPIPAIAPAAVAKIPGARLVRLEGLGHAPQIEAPDRFHEVLLAAIG